MIHAPSQGDIRFVWWYRWKQGHSDAVGHENGDAKSEDDESESSEEESGISTHLYTWG